MERDWVVVRVLDRLKRREMRRYIVVNFEVENTSDGRLCLAMIIACDNYNLRKPKDVTRIICNS